MGKFDNASAHRFMAIAALVGFGIEVVFYLFLFVFLSRTALKLFMITFMKEVGCLMATYLSLVICYFYFQKKKLKKKAECYAI